MMRLLRVKFKGHTCYGVLQDDDTIRPLDRKRNFPSGIPLKNLQVLPTVSPSKIVCLGHNYRTETKDQDKSVPNDPLLFLKPSSAVIGVGQAIVLPPQSKFVECGAGLAMVLGRTCRNVEPEDIPRCIMGYACASDITAEDLQRKDKLYCRAKGFDTFAPIGPWIETEVDDLSNLSIRCLVNGVERLTANTADMVFSPHEAVSFISKVMTLFPGDVVFTGTPRAVGPLFPGDEVRVEIQGVGLLINRVVSTSMDKLESGDQILQ